MIITSVSDRNVRHALWLWAQKVDTTEWSNELLCSASFQDARELWDSRSLDCTPIHWNWVSCLPSSPSKNVPSGISHIRIKEAEFLLCKVGWVYGLWLERKRRECGTWCNSLGIDCRLGWLCRPWRQWDGNGWGMLVNLENLWNGLEQTLTAICVPGNTFTSWPVWDRIYWFTVIYKTYGEYLVINVSYYCILFNVELVAISSWGHLTATLYLWRQKGDLFLSLNV